MALGATGAIHRRPEPAEAPAARVPPPDGLEREPIGRGAPDGRDRTAYHRGHDQKPGRDRREHGDPSERHILGQTQWVCQEASGPEAGETAAQTRRAGRVSRGRSVTKADTRLARPALLSP